MLLVVDQRAEIVRVVWGKFFVDATFGLVDGFTNRGDRLFVGRFLNWWRLELEVIDDLNIYIFTGVFG